MLKLIVLVVCTGMLLKGLNIVTKSKHERDLYIIPENMYIFIYLFAVLIGMILALIVIMYLQ